MGGPNLELFKFGFYVFFPVATLVYFGDPQWYSRHVQPYKDKLLPSEEKTVQRLPTNHIALREELERIKAEKLIRKAAREEETVNGLPSFQPTRLV